MVVVRTLCWILTLGKNITPALFSNLITERSPNLIIEFAMAVKKFIDSEISFLTSFRQAKSLRYPSDATRRHAKRTKHTLDFLKLTDLNCCVAFSFIRALREKGEGGVVFNRRDAARVAATQHNMPGLFEKPALQALLSDLKWR